MIVAKNVIVKGVLLIIASLHVPRLQQHLQVLVEQLNQMAIVLVLIEGFLNLSTCVWLDVPKVVHRNHVWPSIV